MGLAIGNLVAASVLSAGVYALPLRFWGVDLPFVLTALALVVSAGAALLRLPWAELALRVAAWCLFGFGLLIVAIAVLSIGFLLGVHGEFGSMGALMMGLIAAFVFPYGLAYPLFQLLWALRQRNGGATA